MMKRTYVYCGLVVAATLSIGAQPAQAGGSKWSPELTYRRSELTSAAGGDRDGNGQLDCPADAANGDPTPGRPPGGWFEHRFIVKGGKYFQSLPSVAGGDVTRRCPRTFNGYTEGHLHGVMGSRLGVLDDTVFAVYDSVGGYFWQNKIKLQQDPSNMTIPSYLSGRMANPAYPHAVWEFSRNPRNYIDINPGSPDYNIQLTANDCVNLDGVAGWDSDSPAGGAPDGRLGGKRYDPLWWVHSGSDHEGTRCAPPAQLQTFDPDLFLSPTKSFVVWTERYVEGKYVGPDPSRTIVRGFDPPQSNWTTAPFQPLGLHVDLVDSYNLRGGDPATYSVGGRRASLTPMTEWGLKYDLLKDAIAPRVTGVSHSGEQRPVVAWAEVAFKQMGDAGEWAPSGTTASLYVRWNPTNEMSSALSTDSKWPMLGSAGVLGEVCNIQRVSSGRASGRKTEFTGTHDIATMTVAGVERPIVVRTVKLMGSSGCGIRVQRWDGTSWITLGGSDVRQNPFGGDASWPRITVYRNTPYIVWLEPATTGSSSIYVRRYSETTNTWEVIASPSSVAFVTDANVSGPSLSVVSNAFSDASSTTLAPTARIETLLAASFSDMVVVGFSSGNSAQRTMKAYSCLTNPGKKCFGMAQRFTRPMASYNPSQVSVYDRTLDLGVTAGRSVRVAPAPAGASGQQTGWRDDYEISQPGATDMIPSSSAEGSSLYASFTGPVQDHREFDQGLYVKSTFTPPTAPPLPGMGSLHAVSFTPGATTVKVWGSATYGKTTAGVDKFPPISVTLPGAPKIMMARASAYNTGALTAAGQLYVWGYNGYGALCTGDTLDRSTPTLITTPSPVVDFAFTASTLVVLLQDRRVMTCGSGNYGQLGDGSTSGTATTLRQVKVGSAQGAPLADGMAIAAGGYHLCALRTDAKAFCWGYNYYGAVGNGTTTTTAPYGIPFAVALAGDRAVDQISLGGYHSAMVSAEGQLYTWGYNGYGELATGNYAQATSPTAISVSGTIDQLRATLWNTYVLTQDTKLYVAGSNAYGQAGTGSPNTPSYATLTYVTSGVVQLGGGNYAESMIGSYAKGTQDRGRLFFAMGRNDFGQTGSGGTAPMTSPTYVMDPSRFGCGAQDSTFSIASVSSDFQTVTYYCPSGQCASGQGPYCAQSATYSDLADAPTDNDRPQWAKVIPVSPNGYFETGSTVNKSNDDPAPTCASSSAPDVWYMLYPTQTRPVTISLVSQNTNFDTIICVRAGSFNGPVVACNDDYSGVQSQVTVNMNAGDVYYLDIDGYGTASGSFGLSVVAQ